MVSQLEIASRGLEGLRAVQRFRALGLMVSGFRVKRKEKTTGDTHPDYRPEKWQYL